ncbi:MAG: hypothetical protein GXO36_03860 [Chloroflexi bacterium]|nr:hypothetical protein [Chloroflexota bacterium]
MFNIGGPELLVLLVLVLLLFRPEDWVGVMRRLGALWARVLRSEAWQAVTRTRYVLHREFQEALRDANVQEAWRSTVQEMEATMHAAAWGPRSVEGDVRRRRAQGRIPRVTPPASADGAASEADATRAEAGPQPFVASPDLAVDAASARSAPDGMADEAHSAPAEDAS